MPGGDELRPVLVVVMIKSEGAAPNDRACAAMITSMPSALGFRGWASLLVELRPKISCHAQYIVRKRQVPPRQVPPRCSVDECFKPSDAESLLSTEEFSFKCLVDDCRPDYAATAQNEPGDPLRYSHRRSTPLRMGDQTKRAGIEKEELAYG
jgi:hypothetical protein